ncbi:hypothetical protein [Mumia sp. DW29H23]|uniref:hypothetical protein n=1 Tax=Mumia sp. DW29H23 TaxID=3421241 RepID=UPI003D69110C
MIALGVLLLALAVLVGVVVTVEATDPVTLDILGWDVATDGIGAFWAGAATMLVAVVGLALVARGVRRGYRVRKENRQLRKEHRRLEKEQAQARPQPLAGAPGDRDDDVVTDPARDPAYSPESERAYDPEYDAPADGSMADPYERRPAEPYAEAPAEPYETAPSEPHETSPGAASGSTPGTAEPAAGTAEPAAGAASETASERSPDTTAVDSDEPSDADTPSQEQRHGPSSAAGR